MRLVLFRILPLCILAGAALAYAPDNAASDPLDRASALLEMPHSPGELLVRAKPGKGPTLAKFLDSRGAKVKARFRGNLKDLVLIRLDNAANTAGLLSALLRRNDVAYAEPNYRVEPATIPDDPEFDRSWGLHNTGQKYRPYPPRRGTEDIDIDAPEAWDTATGSNSVVIAVIDTGVNYLHPDLSANIWANSDEIPDNDIDDDLNGYKDDIRGWNFRENNNDPSDPDGHGTSVASIAGMTGNNGVGTCGASWNVSLMPLRVGLSESGAISQIVSAFQYALDNGAQIINASWGTVSYSQSLNDAVLAARNANVVLVAAAGNSSSDIDFYFYYPASFGHDNIISVTAIESDGSLADFSNYSDVSVDLAAPGVDIYAAEGNWYTYFGGTSAAAPVVSGVCALLISANPGLTCTETCSRVITSVHRLDSLNGKCVSGGMVNAYNALNFGEPAVVIDSISQTVLGPGGSSTITWTCKQDGTYSVEVGGNGTVNSGSVLASGTCQIDDQILSTVFEEDLPDNEASPVYVIIAEAPIAGFAVVTLFDDQTGPSSQVTYPAPGSTLGTLLQVTGTAADVGGATVATVGVLLYNGSFYYDGGGFSSVDPVYLNATGTSDWIFDSSLVAWQDGTDYTITSWAEDTVGNMAVSADPLSFTYVVGAPTVVIDSVSQRVLGSGDSTIISWQSDLAGDYSIEVGSTGTPGTGTEILSGVCEAASVVDSVVTESELTDNSLNTIHVFVTVSAITGSVNTYLYDDQIPPQSSIIRPINNLTYSELSTVLGRASDTGGASVSGVEVQITDGSNYWDGTSFTVTPAWVEADGAEEWSLDTSSVPWVDYANYSVKSRATDSAGNVEAPSAGVTFMFNSGNTIIPEKDKDSGCTLSESGGGDSCSLLILAALILLYTARRRGKAHSCTS